MKRFFTFLAIAFILYIIYYDVRIGTLPVAKNEAVEVIAGTEVVAPHPSDPYKELKVKPGDTLLSIVEKMNEGQKITSIESVIKDFEELNPDSKAELLQIGKTYKFPLYTNE